MLGSFLSPQLAHEGFLGDKAQDGVLMWPFVLPRAGLQVSKPDVISQLEQGTEPWTEEPGVTGHTGTCGGESRAEAPPGGHAQGSVDRRASLHSAALQTRKPSGCAGCCRAHTGRSVSTSLSFFYRFYFSG